MVKMKHQQDQNVKGSKNSDSTAAAARPPPYVSQVYSLECATTILFIALFKSVNVIAYYYFRLSRELLG